MLRIQTLLLALGLLLVTISGCSTRTLADGPDATTTRRPTYSGQLTPYHSPTATVTITPTDPSTATPLPSPTPVLVKPKP